MGPFKTWVAIASRVVMDVVKSVVVDCTVMVETSVSVSVTVSGKTVSVTARTLVEVVVARKNCKVFV